MSSAGLRGIKTIKDLSADGALKGKIIFLRLDLNVPLDKNQKITDENRIRESLPTIQFALEQGAKLVMASHLGRPKSAQDKEFSLEPVAKRLSELLNKEVILVEEPDSDVVKTLLIGAKNQLVLLENLRFHEGETDNSEELASHWASYTDIYINDAFGASHRAHASIDALPKLIKTKGIGFLIEKELTMLDRLIEKPARPYLAVLGGAKVSDKIEVIEKLIDIVDGFVVGGAMAYTFLRAKNVAIGSSRVETEKLNYCREMVARLEARNKSLLLPVDHVVGTSLTDEKPTITKDQTIEEGKLGLDIGPKTITQFETAIREAKTIFWNGPMGVFENPLYSKGSFAVAKALAENPNTKIVGGGDSAAAAFASGYADKMTHISTGGGASLEYLQGVRLPGLEAVRERKRY